MKISRIYSISPNSVENVETSSNFWISGEFRQNASIILKISDRIPMAMIRMIRSRPDRILHPCWCPLASGGAFVDCFAEEKLLERFPHDKEKRETIGKELRRLCCGNASSYEEGDPRRAIGTSERDAVCGFGPAFIKKNTGTQAIRAGILNYIELAIR